MKSALKNRSFIRLAEFSADAARAPIQVRSEGGSVDLANSSDRLISFVFSDTSVGRDNHVIAADAWQIDQFMRNPVFLWAHDADAPPIGRVVDIGTRGNRLVGTVDYAERDAYPFADTIFRLTKGGFINATSAGWIPKEWKFSTDRSRPGGIDFSKVELLEISQVPVPALPTALVTARAQGIDTGPVFEWAERMLDTSDLAVLPRTELEIIRKEAKMPTAKRKPPRIIELKPDPKSIERRNPFSGLGDFLQTVARASGREFGRAFVDDPRLVRAPTGLNEGDPTSGGFLVSAQYAPELVGLAYEEAVLAPLCDRRETATPLADIKVPAIDETSRADGSRWGGLTSYWEAEAQTVPPSFPRFSNLQFSAKKLFAVCVASNELVADAPMFEAHIRRGFGAEMGFKIDQAALAGTGTGTPQGILKSGALITVSKEGGQAAGSIVAENVRKMWARLPAPSRKRAVWLINEDVESQLEQMGTGGSVDTALYMPQGAGGNECALLKGRPVHVMEQCPTLGTPGDIVLADALHYVLIDGGMKPAVSVHVRFNDYQTVFRFAWRVDGQSGFATPITPYNGSSTRSPFVALAAR